MSVAGHRDASFWLSDADDLTPQPALEGDLDVDVAIVGAGYTGLWTAYYLSGADPTLRVIVLEAEIAGYGASGRNGGWCSALLPQSPTGLARRYGAAAAMALHRTMQSTVDEVGRAARVEGIDCHYAKGGTVTLARSPAQRTRGLAEVAQARAIGLGPDDVTWLESGPARERCAAAGVLGATYTPHCAAIHPGRLVRGLSRVVRGQGVRIAEQSPVTSIRPGVVTTPRGSVRAPVVVRATEAYTPRLPGLGRAVVPLYSLMLATEPLEPGVWAEIGLGQRETFSDFRHLIIYGQRTGDGRLAFGGRGAPYHFGSSISTGYDRVPRVHTALAEALRELFPRLGPVRPVQVWGGPLAAARDWTASVGFDRRTGLAHAGGYVGDGVATANLAGRTLADLITGATTELTRLPWVNHRSPRWEMEPLRWLGINAATRLMASADRAEERTGRAARGADLINRLLGH